MGNPLSWDRDLTSFAVLIRLNDHLTLKTEYYALNEVTGGDIEVDEDTGTTTDNTFVKDNQLLVQMKYEF